MTGTDVTSCVLEGCFPSVTPDLYRILSERPNLTADQRAAALSLALNRSPLSFAKRLGFGLAAGDSVARLFYLHRMAVESELGLKLDRADFWWSRVRDQWEKLHTGHFDWEGLACRLAAETGTGFLSDPDTLRATILREVLIRTHVALANGLVVASPRNLGGKRAEEHFVRATALIDGAGQDEATRRSLQAEVEQLRVVGLVAAQEWDRAVRLIEHPDSRCGCRRSPRSCSWLPAIRPGPGAGQMRCDSRISWQARPRAWAMKCNRAALAPVRRRGRLPEVATM